MPLRKIRVFLYKATISQADSNPRNLKNKFSKSRISGNIIPYGDDSLLLIIENIQNNLIFGRFLKLRNDAPGVINKRRYSERDIILGTDESIKEDSHFLWNLQDKLIFGEYNYHAIRHFSLPLMHYLGELLNSENIDIRPVQDPKTLMKLGREEEITKIIISLAQESLSHQEKTKGVPLLGALRGLSTNDESVVTITISKGKKNTIN
jgi:hypothetical protein